jgi:hypothetical protein
MGSELQRRTAVLVLGLQLADVSAVWQCDVPAGEHGKQFVAGV